MDIAASADAFAPISEPLSKMSETKHFFGDCRADSDIDGCDPPTLHTLDETPQGARRPVKRKEIEPRRFSGKRKCR